MRLLPKIEQLADYAVEGRPLLAALLTPPESDKSPQFYREMEPAEVDELVAAHQRLLPAKARMLAAALGQGASVDDVTGLSMYPPLHLAMVYGSPEMVKLLLAAGAPVDRRDPVDYQTALEFLLGQEKTARSLLPPLVSRAQRAEMVVQLLQAGGQRPYLRLEAQVAERPAADYLAWRPLLALTEGAAPVHALLATGTQPAYEDGDQSSDEPTALAIAAVIGNAGGLEALKPLAPKSLMRGGAGAGQGAWSVQLDAALAAAAAGHYALARSLVEPGMPLGQRGPRHLVGKLVAFKRLDEVKEGTLLHFAVRAGDAGWVRELVGQGAPLEGPSDDQYPSPLVEATAAKQPAMVELLLQFGANPLQRGHMAPAPLLSAIAEGEVERVKSMLSRVDTPERRRELAALSGEIVLAWGLSEVFSAPRQSPMMRQWLDAAGFEPKQVRAAQIAQTIKAGGAGLVRGLIAAGAPVELEPGDVAFQSPLAAAISKGDGSLVAFLVARGAQVERRDGGDWLPIQLALLKGETSILEELLRAKAAFDFPAAPHGSAFDLAVASGLMAPVEVVAKVSGRPLHDACTRTGRATFCECRSWPTSRPWPGSTPLSPTATGTWWICPTAMRASGRIGSISSWTRSSWTKVMNSI